MNWIVTKMKWIMLVAGVLTCTMFYAAIAPQSALLSNFGATLDGPLAELIVRNWGALIGLMGVMLIYGAFDPPSRPLALTIAGISKLIFIGLVLAQGNRYLGYQAGTAVVVDLVMVALFVLYLIGLRRTRGSIR
ncbi:MAG: hypothetical protein JNM09_25745 [Blastocatellia bacterium]|nr:hypothetical protein [Blastocatellia bacterium]